MTEGRDRKPTSSRDAKPVKLTYSYFWPTERGVVFTGPDLLVHYLTTRQVSYYHTRQEAEAERDRLMQENDTYCASRGVHRVFVYDIIERGGTEWQKEGQ